MRATLLVTLLVVTFATVPTTATASSVQSTFLAGVAAALPAPPSSPKTVIASVQASQPATPNLSVDVRTLAAPAIMRVVSHIHGTTTIPAFAIDLKTFDFYDISSRKGETPYEHAVDKYIVGTAFIVSPDGYAITAAHVVSDGEERSYLASELVGEYLPWWFDSLTAKEENAILAQLDPNKDPYEAGLDLGKTLAERGIKYVKEHMSRLSVDVYIATTEAATAVPASKTATNYERLDSIVAKSVKATVVAGNDAYDVDGKDIALLRVPLTQLPAVRINSSTALTPGMTVSVFGYPSSSEMNGGVGLTPSFTSGTINALKQSEGESFKHIQIDAKIAPGSSGGPLLDSSGAVIGVIAKSTSADKIGDSFGFAVPIELASAMLQKQNVNTAPTDDYNTLVQKGLLLKSQRHCKAAIEQFTAAAQANKTFNDIDTYLNPHIEACNALIASGQSLDGFLDEALDWMKTRGTIFWITLIAAIAVVVIVTIVIVYLRRRMKSEEDLVHNLEAEIQHTQAPAAEVIPTTAQPLAEPQPLAAADMPPPLYGPIQTPQSQDPGVQQ